MSTTLIIILLVILVALSSFFSGSEIVYARVNKIKLKKMAEAGNVKAQRAWKTAENFPSLISTILIGNNLVNVATSSLATILFTEYYSKIGAFYGSLIVTGVILIFGEILPKVILTEYSTKASILFSPIINAFHLIFNPLVFVFTKLIDLISPIWTPKEEEEDDDTTSGELINIIEDVKEGGYVDDDTVELVSQAIEFKDTTCQEILTPRVDVFAYDINNDIKELLNNENIFKYSRILVYEDRIDNIIGVLNTKKLILKALLKEKINVRNMLTKPLRVHKTKSLTSLLKEFKDTGTHIAIVLDEFGGMLGIITLEDVLEEVVGDIWDEMDDIHEDVLNKKGNTFVIDGDMNIEDMFEEIGYKEEDFESEYDTVAGWCTEVLDHFPKKGDKFSYNNLDVIILKVDDVRVELIKVIVNEIDEDDE